MAKVSASLLLTLSSFHCISFGSFDLGVLPLDGHDFVLLLIVTSRSAVLRQGTGLDAVLRFRTYVRSHDHQFTGYQFRFCSASWKLHAVAVQLHPYPTAFSPLIDCAY